jgi:hypothetical protein
VKLLQECGQKKVGRVEMKEVAGDRRKAQRIARTLLRLSQTAKVGHKKLLKHRAGGSMFSRRELKPNQANFKDETFFLALFSRAGNFLFVTLPNQYRNEPFKENGFRVSPHLTTLIIVLAEKPVEVQVRGQAVPI